MPIIRNSRKFPLRNHRFLPNIVTSCYYINSIRIPGYRLETWNLLEYAPTQERSVISYSESRDVLDIYILVIEPRVENEDVRGNLFDTFQNMRLHQGIPSVEHYYMIYESLPRLFSRVPDRRGIPQCPESHPIP